MLNKNIGTLMPTDGVTQIEERVSNLIVDHLHLT
jgi:hypothetical protein